MRRILQNKTQRCDKEYRLRIKKYNEYVDRINGILRLPYKRRQLQINQDRLEFYQDKINKINNYL